MVVHWKKYIFTLNDFYGKERPDKLLKKADIHAYYQQKELINPTRWLIIHRQVLTLCIDLHKSAEELRKEMNRTTRYQINKAGRDELTLTCITEPTLQDIEQFVAFFTPFAREKGIENCRVDKLTSLMENNMLTITSVQHKDGRTLAAHAYIVLDKRAIMFYSCSGRFKNSDIPGLHISRANRYLHWHNILHFKDKGFDLYDFMGLSINSKDTAQQSINTFKKGFGGFDVVEYQSFIPQNIRGKILTLVLMFLWRNQAEIIRKNHFPATAYLKELEDQ